MLDMDSNESLTYAPHEGSAYHAQFDGTCYHPFGPLDQFGDVVRPAMMRQWRIAAAWPRRDARRGPQGTRETAPTFAGQTGRVAGGEASRREYCGDCQLGPIIGYSLPHGSRLPSPGGPDKESARESEMTAWARAELRRMLRASLAAEVAAEPPAQISVVFITRAAGR